MAVEHLLQQTCIFFDNRQSPKHRVFEATMARIGRLLDEQQEQDLQESGDQRAVDAQKQALKVQMRPYNTLLWQLVSCMHKIFDVSCYTAWWLCNRHLFLQIYATLVVHQQSALLAKHVMYLNKSTPWSPILVCSLQQRQCPQWGLIGGNCVVCVQP